MFASKTGKSSSDRVILSPDETIALILDFDRSVVAATHGNNAIRNRTVFNLKRKLFRLLVGRPANAIERKMLDC